ncbi:MAG: hypothetical protein ABI832_23100 [bacterium]
MQGVLSATPGLDPAALRLDHMPDSRVRRHRLVLRAVWQDSEGLPADLSTIRQVLSCDAGQALAPIQLLDLPDEPFATLAEASLTVQLRANYGSAFSRITP